MIKLGLLKWSNQFSYGKNNVIDLASNKLTQIIGMNGAGKSSIPLIIEEVLFNKNSKGIKKGDIANRNSGISGYSASLDFEINDVPYTITTSRSGATLKAKLTQGVTDLSSHTSTGTFTTLQNLLGTDFNIFPQVVYQSQYSGLSFLTDTDTTRKQFLSNLMNISEYNAISAQLKVLAKAANETRLKLSGKLTSFVQQQETLLKQDLTPKEVPEPLTIDIEDKVAAIATLNAEKASANAAIAAAAERKRLIDKVESLRKLVDVKFLGVPLADVQREKAENNKIYNDIYQHKAKINDLAKALRGICPTCKQPIDSHVVDEELAVHKKAVAELEPKQAEIVGALAIKENHNNKVLANEKRQNEVDAYKDFDLSPLPVPDLGNIGSEITRLTNEINQARAEVSAITTAIKISNEHNAKIEVYQEQLNRLSIELVSLNSEFSAISDEVSDLEVLVKTFSNTGLITHDLHLLVEELANQTNDYLLKISGGRFAINFNISGEKLNVEILDNGLATTMECLSSGEQARVNIATLLAIRSLARSLGNIDINVLFLDEILNVLDLEGRETIIEVLLEENLNAFIVSHGWQHPLVERIEVYKEGEISYIRNDS